MAEEWISIQEAAALSGYNAEYLREKIRKGEREGKPPFTSRKFADVYQIERQSFNDFLRASKSAKDRRHGPKRLLDKKRRK